MRELGYTEGQDFEMLYRFADFHADRLPQLAVELVQVKPDVIVGPATIQAVALKKATDTIPIVVGAMADPVELGLIKSYARPDGNVIGIMLYVAGLPTKQLELAREVVPGATRIGLLDDVTDPKARPQSRIKAAGEKLEINIIPVEVRTATDIGQAYEAFAAAKTEVVVVEQSSMLINARQEIADAAAAKKLPTLAASFGNWLRQCCDQASLPKGISAHGLRKATARRLAELGCSTHQIAAITGHATLSEVQRYTKAADRKRLAQEAMKRLIEDRS
jgi:putative ABC transport system substrate-binding protein